MQYSETLFITRFVITAKFVITSIQSAQKSADRVCFHRRSHVHLKENIHFGYLLESPRVEAILTNTQNV